MRPTLLQLWCPLSSGVGLAWELAPHHQGLTVAGGILPCVASGFVRAWPHAGWAAENNGVGAGLGAGIAGWQPSRTNPQGPSCASARARNLIWQGEGPRPGWWGGRCSLRDAVCVHGNLRASTGGFSII